MRNEESVLLETAKAAERSGNYARAFDAWQRLASMTNRPDYLCKVGRAAHKLGRWTGAEKAFLDAIEVDKTFWLAMVFLGSLFLARTDRDPSTNARTAKAWLEQGVAAAPSAMSLSLLGAAHDRLGEKEAAREAFRKAIELDESYAEAHFNLGLLLATDGQNEEAERLLRKATQLDPILTKRTVGSEFSCKNSENILRLRTSSGALSRLILRTQSPISISTARQVVQAQINREPTAKSKFHEIRKRADGAFVKQ